MAVQLCSLHKHAALPTLLCGDLHTGTTRAADRLPADFGGLTALQTPFAESGPEQVHDTSSSPRSLLWEKHANSEATPAGRRACSLFGMQPTDHYC